ncbi:heparinase II/III family protein [Haladaptatus sp. GCM10025707]|uniref:heparinase II/III family protein n=1 Tax=Haladaptatus sp. GCM10025707 TaxID=3252658 RepID=UPI0036071FFF
MRDWAIAFTTTAVKMEPSQVRGVLHRKMKSRLLPYIPVDKSKKYGGNTPTGGVNFDSVTETIDLVRSTLDNDYKSYLEDNIQALRDGTLSLLGRSVKGGNQFPARIPPLVGEKYNYPRQWTLKLLSLEPALWISLCPDSTTVEFAESLLNWLEAWDTSRISKIGDSNSFRRYWAPYTVSRRICNLVRLGVIFEKESTNTEILQRSLIRDVQFLKNHIEYDVGGNHLVENACALLVGGTALSDDEAKTQGLKILVEELPSQLLEDGMHYERSTMYHTILLYQLTWSLSVLQESGYSIPIPIKSDIKSMYEFLYCVSPGNANYPLLNDSVYHECPSRVSCLRLAEKVFNFNPQIRKC